MSTRQRTTWQGGGDKAAGTQPVLPVERARRASAHPATPDEGAAHPAHQPDPGEHDYENGDTSSWAEDPTTGPYPNSAHPAMPDEGAAHPAHRQTETAPSTGAAKAAARELRAAVEQKAAKCIRIASALLGPKATVAQVEDQALAFMDMSDAAIQVTLDRLAAEEAEEDEDDKGKEAADESEEEAEDDKGKEASADEALLRRLLAEEEDEAEDKGEDKEASASKSATEQILAAINALGSRLTALESGKTSTTTTTADDDAMLANLLAEEKEACGEPMAQGDDVESMLYSMIDEEPMASDVIDEGEPMAHVDFVDEGDLGIDMGLVEDPMGLLGEVEMSEDEDALLAQLFADTRLASKKGEDEDEEEEESEEESEEEEEKEAKKKAAAAAARKPRPKKASTAGATRLGRVTKEASSDIKELEKLWPSAPDVTGVFG